MELLITVIIWVILLSIMEDNKALVWRVLFFFTTLYLLFLVFTELVANQLFNIIK